MDEKKVDQLWYTASVKGLWGTAGFRVRAASEGWNKLDTTQRDSLLQYMSYTLPDGMHHADAMRGDAPRSLAFLKTSIGWIIVHRVYSWQDGGRPGNFFCHLLFSLPANFSAQDAIGLWGWAAWQEKDRLEVETLLPRLPGELREKADSESETLFSYLPSEETHKTQVIEELQSALRFVIQAFPLCQGTQRVYIVAQDYIVAALVWGLAHSLPHSWLDQLTFSTYERDVFKATANIIGTTKSDTRSDPLAPEFYKTNKYGFAFNYYRPEEKSQLPMKPDIAEYADFATWCLTTGNKAILDAFLLLVEYANSLDKYKNKDIDFLPLYNALYRAQSFAHDILNLLIDALFNEFDITINTIKVVAIEIRVAAQTVLDHIDRVVPTKSLWLSLLVGCREYLPPDRQVRSRPWDTREWLLKRWKSRIEEVHLITPWLYCNERETVEFFSLELPESWQVQAVKLFDKGLFIDAFDQLSMAMQSGQIRNLIWPVRFMFLVRLAEVGQGETTSVVFWLPTSWRELSECLALNLPLEWGRKALVKLLDDPKIMPITLQNLEKLVKQYLPVFRKLLPSLPMYLSRTRQTEVLAIFECVRLQDNKSRLELLSSLVTTDVVNLELLAMWVDLLQLTRDEKARLFRYHAREFLSRSPLAIVVIDCMDNYITSITASNFIREQPILDILCPEQEKFSHQVELTNAVLEWHLILESYIGRTTQLVERTYLSSLITAIHRRNKATKTNIGVEKAYRDNLLDNMVVAVCSYSDLCHAIDALMCLSDTSKEVVFGELMPYVQKRYKRNNELALLVPYIRYILEETQMNLNEGTILGNIITSYLRSVEINTNPHEQIIEIVHFLQRNSMRLSSHLKKLVESWHAVFESYLGSGPEFTEVALSKLGEAIKDLHMENNAHYRAVLLKNIVHRIQNSDHLASDINRIYYGEKLIVAIQKLAPVLAKGDEKTLYKELYSYCRHEDQAAQYLFLDICIKLGYQSPREFMEQGMQRMHSLSSELFLRKEK